MKLAGWLTTGSAASAFVLTLLPGVDASLEIWLGMLGPLVVVGAGWIVVERTERQQSVNMTRIQVQLLVAKLVFVGGYVTAILGMSPARPVPFAMSFTGYFLVLYGVEAIALYRLMRPRFTKE